MNELQATAIDLEVAEAALNSAAQLVRTHVGAAQEIAAERAASDPYLLLRFGQLRARLHAAQGLLARAVRLKQNTTDAQHSNAKPAAVIAALQASAFARDVTLEIGNELTALGGEARELWQAQGVSAPSIRDAHHQSYFAIGKYYLTGELTSANDAQGFAAPAPQSAAPKAPVQKDAPSSDMPS